MMYIVKKLKKNWFLNRDRCGRRRRGHRARSDRFGNVSGNELRVNKLECRRKNAGETLSLSVGGDTSVLA